MKRQQKISAARNRNYRDQTLSVLIEEHPENGVYTGRTEFQAPEVDGITYIRADNLQTGSFSAVRFPMRSNTIWWESRYEQRPEEQHIRAGPRGSG